MQQVVCCTLAGAGHPDLVEAVYQTDKGFDHVVVSTPPASHLFVHSTVQNTTLTLFEDQRAKDATARSAPQRHVLIAPESIADAHHCTCRLRLSTFTRRRAHRTLTPLIHRTLGG
jgi:hypothetical protein